LLYKIDMVWSYALEYENSQNIVEAKRNAIAKWKTLSVDYVITVDKRMTKYQDCSSKPTF